MKKSAAAVIAISCSFQLQAVAQSVWLPEANQLIVTPVFTYQTYDEFWAGEKSTKLTDDVEQIFGGVTIEYGITARIAADLTLGYTRTETSAFTPSEEDDDGLADTTFGLRYQFLDENATTCPYAPTLALRVGGIIAGSYDENFPFSAGDGASGVQTSLLFGKQFGDTGFGIFGDIGYRHRGEHVPDDFLGSIGVFQTIKSFTLSVAYRHIQSLWGDDIDEPPFRFPELEEIQQNIEAGIGYTDRGGRYYQFFYAHTLDGENTGEKDIFGFSASFPIGLK